MLLCAVLALTASNVRSRASADGTVLQQNMCIANDVQSRSVVAASALVEEVTDEQATIGTEERQVWPRRMTANKDQREGDQARCTNGNGHQASYGESMYVFGAFVDSSGARGPQH
jgi:hypothetical protein